MSLHLAKILFGTATVVALMVLWWLWMQENFETRKEDSVKKLRRDYVERRLGIVRRGSPPPLWPHRERRVAGKDRRKDIVP